MIEASASNTHVPRIALPIAYTGSLYTPNDYQEMPYTEHGIAYTPKTTES